MQAAEYETKGNVLLIRLKADLDHHTAVAIRETADTLLARSGAKHILFDFTGVEFMDSSGIGMLIGRSRTMGFRKGRVWATGMSNRIRRLFDAAGLGQLIAVKEELDGE